MEKRVLLAGVICTIFLMLYSQATGMNRPVQKPPVAATLNSGQLPGIEQARTFPAEFAREEVIHLESDELSIDFGAVSGAARLVRLKKFPAGGGVVSFGDSLPAFLIEGAAKSWKRVDGGLDSVEFVGEEKDRVWKLKYAIRPGEPVLDVYLDGGGSEGKAEAVGAAVGWGRSVSSDARTNILEFVAAHEAKDGKIKYTHGGPPGRVRIVPRGTSIFTLSERYFCTIFRPGSGDAEIRVFPSPKGTIAAYIQPVGQPAGPDTPWATIYYGPRDFFYLRRSGFEHAFKLGIIGQIGLALLIALGWISRSVHNYGAGIILFSMLISFCTAPFTLLSIRSMKKMRELQPTIDKITKQYKDDPTRTQKEIFAIYKENRVSPISGCLPMLLQLPIFIAMFQAISHFIALRGAKFLWIQDLSLPDHAFQISGFGVNVLPVVMAGGMFLQSRLSQRTMPQSDSNPMSTAMSGPFMSILFGVMFYNVPSGLVLYWLSNTVFQIFLYRMVK